MIYFRNMSEPADWDWFKKRTHTILCEDSQGIVAFNEDGIIQAASVFDSWTVDACSVHLAIDNPLVLRHGFLTELARHLFITCGRKRIFGLVPSNNKKARRLNKHLGYTEVAVIPDAVKEGVDYIVVRMDKADCRWLPQELRRAA